MLRIDELDQQLVKVWCPGADHTGNFLLRNKKMGFKSIYDRNLRAGLPRNLG